MHTPTKQKERRLRPNHTHNQHLRARQRNITRQRSTNRKGRQRAPNKPMSFRRKRARSPPSTLPRPKKTRPSHKPSTSKQFNPHRHPPTKPQPQRNQPQNQTRRRSQIQQLQTLPHPTRNHKPTRAPRATRNIQKRTAIKQSPHQITRTLRPKTSDGPTRTKPPKW